MQLGLGHRPRAGEVRAAYERGAVGPAGHPGPMLPSRARQQALRPVWRRGHVQNSHSGTLRSDRRERVRRQSRASGLAPGRATASSPSCAHRRGAAACSSACRSVASCESASPSYSATSPNPTHCPRLRLGGRGGDAIVHLVAIPRDLNGGRDLLRVNTEGTHHVVEAAQAAGVRRFMHQCALGVEDDPSFHYATLQGAAARRIVRESGLDWTILQADRSCGATATASSASSRCSPALVARRHRPCPVAGWRRFQPLLGGRPRADRRRVASSGRETIGQTFELGGPALLDLSRRSRAEVLAGARPASASSCRCRWPLISLVAARAEVASRCRFRSRPTSSAT